MLPTSSARIGVVGAGVVGLSTALRLKQELHDLQVTVIADIFSPNTTSDGSGGFWEPFALGDTPKSSIRKWSKDTWDFLQTLSCGPVAQEVGAQFISGYTLHIDDTFQDPFFKDIVLGYRRLTENELHLFPYAKWGSFHTTLQIDVKKYLPWLMKKFKSLGGKVEHQTVHHLNELSNRFDILVNCTGVRAGELVGDKQVVPIRGQIFRVKAPWLHHFYLVEGDDGKVPCTYIFPLGSLVVVGGVAQDGRWDQNVDKVDSINIWNRAISYLPSLTHAEDVTEWVGLRPGRTQVRLETEMLVNGSSTVPVIHNYGHGGAGVTLHWGCARDVVLLVEQMIKGKRWSKL